MPLTLAPFQLNWRALIAFVMLAAFVLPVTAKAACYEATAPSRVAVQMIIKTDAAATTATEAPAPAKKPVGKPDHAALCQHAHCGHVQAWPEATADLEVLRLAGLRPASSPHHHAVAGWLIDGPERPPQA